MHKLNKKGNNHSSLIDTLVEASQNFETVKPVDSEFANQVIRILGQPSQSLDDIFKGAVKTAQQNRIAQALADVGSEMDAMPPEEGMDDMAPDMGDEALGDTPEFGAEQEPESMGIDALSLVDQALEALTKAKQELQGNSTDAVDGLDDDMGDETLADDVALDEGGMGEELGDDLDNLADDVGLADEPKPMAQQPMGQPMAQPGQQPMAPTASSKKKSKIASKFDTSWNEFTGKLARSNELLGMEEAGQSPPDWDEAAMALAKEKYQNKALQMAWVLHENGVSGQQYMARNGKPGEYHHYPKDDDQLNVGMSEGFTPEHAYRNLKQRLPDIPPLESLQSKGPF